MTAPRPAPPPSPAAARPDVGARRHYDAFISYNHDADDRLAPHLQRGMHRLAKPWRSRRAIEVFRDTTGLGADPDLRDALTAALDSADWLVLLASPGAAASRWVGEEIRHTIERKGADRILLVLTAGTLEWDDERGDFTPDSTAVHPLLRGAFRSRPVWVDLTWATGASDLSLANPRFRRDVARLAAPIHGRTEEEVLVEDARQRRRTTRTVQVAAAALAVLGVLSTVAAVLAVQRQQEAAAERAVAVEEERVAVERRDEAEAQAAVARSRELAARALAIADVATGVPGDPAGTPVDPVAPLLLAVQAHAVAPTGEAAGAMLTLASGWGVDQGLVTPADPGAGAAAVQDVQTVARDAPVMVVRDGSTSRAVDTGSGRTWTLPSGTWTLSPGGDVAFSGRGELWALPAEGEAEPIAVRAPPPAGPADWDAAGAVLVYPAAGADTGTFLTTSWAGTLAVVDVRDRSVRTLELDSGVVCADCTAGTVALAPDGTFAVVGGGSGRLTRVDLGDGSVATGAQSPEGDWRSVHVTADGSTVLARDGEERRQLAAGDLSESGPSVFAPDLGVLRWSATDRPLAGPDGCTGARLVDPATYAVVAEISVPTSFAEGVGCEPSTEPLGWWDEQTVLTPSGLWPVDADRLVELVCGAVGRAMTAEERGAWAGPALDGEGLACAEEAS